MCLTTYKRRATVGKKPVKCYKVILFRHDRWETPYQKDEVPEKILNGEVNLKSRVLGITQYDDIWLSSVFGVSLGSGFIHAYTSKEAAIAESNDWAYQSRIYECEIPAGVPYFRGVNHDICAHEIKFNKLSVENIPEWDGWRYVSKITKY